VQVGGGVSLHSRKWGARLSVSSQLSGLKASGLGFLVFPVISFRVSGEWPVVLDWARP